MQEAAYPAKQARHGAYRSDHDASGLVAPQFAERADQRIKLGESFPAWRYEREEQALAVELLEVEGLLGEERGGGARGGGCFVHRARRRLLLGGGLGNGGGGAGEERRGWLRQGDLAKPGMREDVEQDALAFLPYAEHPAGRLEAACGAAVDAYVERDGAFDRLDDVAE